jgi:hypothetical protein
VPGVASEIDGIAQFLDVLYRVYAAGSASTKLRLDTDEMSLRADGTLVQHFGNCVFPCISFVQMREVTILAAFADTIRVMLTWMLKRPKVALAPGADAAEARARDGG